MNAKRRVSYINGCEERLALVQPVKSKERQ